MNKLLHQASDVSIFSTQRRKETFSHLFQQRTAWNLKWQQINFHIYYASFHYIV